MRINPLQGKRSRRRMGTLNQQLAKAEGLSPNSLVSQIFNFLESIEDELAQLNRDQLFESSIDIFGNPLGYYSRATERITTMEWELGLRAEEDIKEQGDPYTMKDQNIFLPSIFAKVTRDYITFGSSDPKLDDIFENERLLTKSFFGLTEDNKLAVIQEQIKPHLLRISKQILGI